MSKTKKILMLTNIVILTILVTNLATSQAAVPSWGPGDIFIWGILDRTTTETYDFEEDVGQVVDILTNAEVEYNITAIDTVQEEYDAYSTSTGGTTFLNDRDYDVDEYIDDYLDNLFNFISVDYVWDYANNVSVCTSFSTSLGYFYLLEPDWALINEAYIDMLNGSVVIDTLADPYDPIIYNYTLADVLGDIKVNIMGKGTLARGLNQFTSAKTKWTFEFDLSNYIMDSYWNGSMTLYRPYTTYIETWTIEYENGGILKDFRYTFDMELTDEDTTTNVFVDSRRALGGMKAATADFGTFAAVGGLVFISTLAIIIKRKKK
ncbi:MAG: hypothetical protein FK733_12410 [Asgard group archaeon]|nr:hypothetical protein [Asgard group archaeon]